MKESETGNQLPETQEAATPSSPELSGSKKRVATGLVNAAELFIDDFELDDLFSEEIARSRSAESEPSRTLHGMGSIRSEGEETFSASGGEESASSSEIIPLDAGLLPSVTDFSLTDEGEAARRKPEAASTEVTAEPDPVEDEPMTTDETYLSPEALRDVGNSLTRSSAKTGSEAEITSREMECLSSGDAAVCDAAPKQDDVGAHEAAATGGDVSAAAAGETASEVKSILDMNPGAAIEAACKALEAATRELNESYRRQSQHNTAKASVEEACSDPGSESGEAESVEPVGIKDAGKKEISSGEAPAVISKSAPKKPEEGGGISMSEPLVSLKTKTLIEMHTQLTNLTGKQVGQRPEWTDLETVFLPDREKECKKFYWHVEHRQKAKRKDVFLIAAPEGAGKTTFLAGVYAQLARFSNDIVTIAPALSKSKRAFSAIRNILEQRLYITASDLETAAVQLRGAVKSMLSPKRGGTEEGEESPEVTEALENLKDLWAKSQMTREAYQHEIIVNMKPNPKLESTAILDMNGGQILNEGPQESPTSDRRLKTMDSMIREAVGVNRATDEGERDIDAEVDPYINAVRALFEADLKHNQLVLIFDDIDLYDEESLVLLARVYDDLQECPLTIILTMRNTVELPKAFRNIRTTEYELRSMSDEDLTCFTQRILEQLSQQREKMIVPTELCRVVAQHACGSPKRALDLMMTHFTPDQMITWSDSLEKLRHEAAPASLLKDLKQRLFMLSERERTVLCIASILNGEPFTANTIDAVIGDEDEKVSSLPYLHNLYETGFLSHTKMCHLQNTVTYIFKHEFERQAITSFVSKEIRRRVYTKAAQWYALNNPDNRFNETIGDLCFALSEQSRQAATRLSGGSEGEAPKTVEEAELIAQANASALEAAHYYERVAYSALSRSQYIQAKKLFKKLLRALPSENIARCIQAVLDASRVYLSLGNTDDAMRLAHSAWRHAERYSAFSMAASAAAQVAEILIRMGNPRHVKKYISAARIMLNQCMIPSIMLTTYILEIRLYVLKNRFKRAQALAKKARAFSDKYGIDTKESLELKFYEAQITAVMGNPRDAVMMYEDVLADSETMHYKDLYARACHRMGSLLFKLDENDKAFRAWNKALGLAQEMNDMFLHASLLCDISEGAIMLKANRTARAANEQCLTLAQHLRQKELIGRCLVNNASLQYEHGQYAKAERTLRKVHKISHHLGIMRLTLKSVALMARCYANPENEQYDPRHAGVLFERVSHLYKSQGMILDYAAIQPQYADYFISMKQNIQAKNAFNRARDVYTRYGMTKAAASVSKAIDKILQETSISDEEV